MRTPLTGTAGKVFQATRVALPPVYREIETAPKPERPAIEPIPKTWC